MNPRNDTGWHSGAREVLLVLALLACAFACATDDDSSASQEDEGAPAAVRDCVDQAVAWSIGGGFTTTHKSRLGPCANFLYERTRYSSGTPEVSCTLEVPRKNRPSLDAIDAALAHPKVKAALAPFTRFGISPADAPVFFVETDVGQLWISALPCEERAGCVDAPAAVLELRDLLLELQDELSMAAACAGDAGEP